MCAFENFLTLARLQAFNMDHTLAVFATYAAFLVDGNLLTNLVSIGKKSPETGPNPPAPATAGGMNTPTLFEGLITFGSLSTNLANRSRR